MALTDVVAPSVVAPSVVAPKHARPRHAAAGTLIAEHGLIGDLQTAALVATDGTIDWYCCPRFDSPSVFARLLDHRRGGYFRVAPEAEDCVVKQLHFPDTAVLITRFMSDTGVAELVDFMPIADNPKLATKTHRIVRMVRGVRGEMRLKLECAPRFDYARGRHTVEITEHGAVLDGGDLRLTLHGAAGLERRGEDVHLSRLVRANETFGVVLENAFVQYHGTDVMDASVLTMPITGFVAPTEPGWLSTLDAIEQELVSDSLVYRYNPSASPDGLTGDEGTFSICTFWYVDALARAGRLDKARYAFEKMLTYANHVGLFSEEIGPTGEQLGNFPQAFSHLSLIGAAVQLDAALNQAQAARSR